MIRGAPPMLDPPGSCKKSVGAAAVRRLQRDAWGTLMRQTDTLVC